MNLFVWIPLGLLFILLVLAFYKRYQMIKNIEEVADHPELKHLNDADFEKFIAKGVSLVDFWAPWCTPCKIQAPVLNQLAEELEGQAQIAKIDIDHNKKMASTYGVKNIPTLILYKDGEPVKRFVGVKSKGVLSKAILQHV